MKNEIELANPGADRNGRASEEVRDVVTKVLNLTPADEDLLKKGFLAVMEANYEDPQCPLSPKETLILEAARRYPKEALIAYWRLKESGMNADQIIETVADANPHAATRAESVAAYISSPRAEEIYKKSLTALGGEGRDSLSRQGYLTREGDGDLLRLEDEVINGNPWIQEIIVNLMKRLPKSCLAYARRFGNADWYQEVLVAAITQEPEEAKTRGISLAA